ncbi:Hypothetical protein A7982_10469 [Minicystis rosea]|nr:Hypothetical protein A7982_10469 [Minicystis rosea]
MRRLFVASLCLIAAWTVAAVSACDADTTETCLAGPCTGGSGGTAGAGAAAACSSTPKTGEIPCDVFAIIHASCNPCHTDPLAGGAPFPILTYADTQAEFHAGKLVFQQMYDQIQPGAAPQMPLGDVMMSDADRKTLSDWLSACTPPAPAGMGCGCPGPGCD